MKQHYDMKKFLLIGALLLVAFSSAFAQRVAIKNNLAYDALLAPNLSLELAFGRKIKSGATGWCSLNFVFGLVMLLIAGSLVYMLMEGL